MIQLKRILLPTDFSELMAQAKTYAAALAEQYAAELHVLHVVESLPPAFPDYGGSFWANYVQEAETEARERLKQVFDPEWSERHPVVTAVRRGAAYVEIVRYAREHDIDLIVVSTHGRTGLPHVMLGSVAERIVRKASCPVLTVRPRGHQFVMP